MPTLLHVLDSGIVVAILEKELDLTPVDHEGEDEQGSPQQEVLHQPRGHSGW